MGEAIRSETHGPVRRLTLCRAGEYNTINPTLRDELAAGLQEAERDPGVRVILLDAEGPAFCAGYGLDWSTSAQAEETADGAWDSAADRRFIDRFASTWAQLHESSKPTIAAVGGWCVAGGTNIAFNAHLIIASESARFGYPPARVWGIPEAPWNWIARLGLQNARRYMLTGDEFDARTALAMGAVLEVVPDAQLHERAMELAGRIALVPLNQLQMITWAINAPADHMYDPRTSRMLGTLFDGIARHTEEGRRFVARAEQVGFREAVRERDRPFGDYGERGD